MPLLHEPGVIAMELDDTMEEIDAVMLNGDAKYGDMAWLNNKDNPNKERMDHLQAMERHLYRFIRGEPIDRDSKLPALAHVAARAIMALEFDRQVRFGRSSKGAPSLTHDQLQQICNLFIIGAVHTRAAGTAAGEERAKEMEDFAALFDQSGVMAFGKEHIR